MCYNLVVMEKNKLDFYFGTRGALSKYDLMNSNDLLKCYLHAEYFDEDKEGILQAFQNKFFKFLAVPTIPLKLKPIFDSGVFSVRNTKKRIQNVKILMDPNSDPTETFFTVPHEAKHAEQAYNLHKFLNYHIVPKDNLGKVIIVSNILEQFSQNYVQNLRYESEIDELDAFVFEINEMNKLMIKYPLYFNFDFNLYIRERIFNLLYGVRYNFEGIENAEIKKSIINLKRGINSALSGEYVVECQNAIKAIIKSGFNVERAYESIVKNMDKYGSWIMQENHRFNKLGATTIHLVDRNGLNYAPHNTYISDENVIDDNSIDPNSEYAEYIKKYVCVGSEKALNQLECFYFEKNV